MSNIGLGTMLIQSQSYDNIIYLLKVAFTNHSLIISGLFKVIIT